MGVYGPVEVLNKLDELKVALDTLAKGLARSLKAFVLARCESVPRMPKSRAG